MFSSIKLVALEHSDISVNFGKYTQIITPQKSSNTNRKLENKKKLHWNIVHDTHTHTHIYRSKYFVRSKKLYLMCYNTIYLDDWYFDIMRTRHYIAAANIQAN